MKTMKLTISAAAAALFLVTLSGSARADGIALRASQLKKNDLSALKLKIKQARAKNPSVFKKVADAPKLAVQMDEQKRGRAATITLPLRALGPDALYPMLEMLAVDGPTRGKMSDSAWTTLRSGLLEAVGLLRDKRAKPVLESILRHETEFEVVRASAEALGRIGDDDSAKKLAKLALKPSQKQVAVVAALGECRRIVAAEALAKLVGSGDDAQEQVVIKSLGTVGNAWAWETSEISKSGEGSKVRAIAARALMKSFIANKRYIREKAKRALMVVNDPSTTQLIARARKGASAELGAALDELALAMAQNPIN
jgi:hypothetical protein